MYTNFFSLSEQPFSIAPDPKYLFMSDRHREALNHLNHGLGGAGTGGFVLLTGEVGTGKTTVSRCLMADIPKDTQLAFILNPTLSSQELLATICDELKIRYRKTGATLKTLTDKISEKLLKNHANNINTLLIIDEAQHLEPQVLEQLRLLTNLETDTKKLLQVILIGQPELQQLLKRRDLRQLAQRITARYHLLPLNQQELAAYIKHRLSVADCHRALFNKGALVAIHQLSGGIPRLVNLLCHSALMEAYNTNNAIVDKKIVYKAASHALGDDFEPVIWWQNKSIQIASAASVLLAVLVAGFWLGKSEPPHRQNNEQLEVSSSDLVKAALPESQQVAVVESSNALAKMQPSVPQQEQLIVSDSKLAKAQPSEPQQEQLVVTGSKLVKTQPTEPQQEQLVVSGSKLAKAQPPKPQQEQSVVSRNELAQTQTTPKASATSKQQEKVKPQLKSEASEINYQVEAVEGVSDDLLARFKAAVDDTKKLSKNTPKPEPKAIIDTDIKSLTQMPVWVQEGIPSLHFEQHIYASDGGGWVNVNGRDRYEGDSIANGVYIEKILPQQVILTYRGEKFSLPALTNW